MLRILQKRKELRNHAASFYSKLSTQEAVASAGEKLLIALYGGTEEENYLN